ncbi:MAG: helix-turn-helix transcriptional regulator [Deltaproteobacteria bacterium]|jgi:DNA-binding HxlR family transcriptional regulator|nr:helix-turn-helix transcriptional regulator [Deltaproteobacteria bacterium]MBW2497134.1 helix-turn-helix transcriptional regulator [Deltaproteobacteria bacterium]
MHSTPLDDRECGVARALELLGDGWTLLIVRQAFFGVRRFADFQRDLGIARNVLSQRLKSLVEAEVLQRVDAGRHGTRFEYRLTAKGEALLPVLTSLREWADAWVFGEGREPLIVRDRETGERIPRLEVRNTEGRVLGRREIRTEPGPGASVRMRRFFESRARQPSDDRPHPE